MSNYPVTDRAIVRYLERVYGVDISSLKRRIAKTTLEGRNRGARAVISDGVRYSLSPTGQVVAVNGIRKAMSNRGERWKSRRK